MPEPPVAAVAAATLVWLNSKEIIFVPAGAVDKETIFIINILLITTIIGGYFKFAVSSVRFFGFVNIGRRR